MRITTDTQGDVTVLTVSGELNHDSAGKFGEACRAELGQGRRDFAVDLSAVTTIDSAGLEALTALQRECEEQLGMVRLCGARDNVRKILEMTRLDRVLPVHEGLEETLSSFI
ncbi:MAG: hypothetical protein AMXMBFR13_49980 [Phycisphaerae bacterium]|jgi:anti-anti-sigma factor